MLEELKVGVPVTAACQHVGISWASHQRAMDAGRDAEQLAERGEPLDERQELYRSYRADVDRARAEAVAIHVALVGQAAHGGKLVKEVIRRYRNDDGEMVTETEREYTRPDWRASKFLLSVSVAREEFSERHRASVEVTGAGGGPVEVVPAEVAIQTIAQRLQAVAATQAKQLPGGWDPPNDDDITDAELVDEGNVA